MQNSITTTSTIRAQYIQHHLRRMGYQAGRVHRTVTSDAPVSTLDKLEQLSIAKTRNS